MSVSASKKAQLMKHKCVCVKKVVFLEFFDEREIPPEAEQKRGRGVTK